MRGLYQRIAIHARPLAFEKGLDLKFRGGHHLTCVDPGLLERVLRNLVSNAIRYTEDGGVLVSCRQRGGQLLLQVWDSGIGIAETNREHIFEEFYQVVSPEGLTPPPRRGMGLGLAIVRRVVDLMGLPLDLRSRLGRGTVFSLLMPMGHADLVAKPGPEELLDLGAGLEQRLVVVLDDDPAVGDAMTQLLQEWQARVAVFATVPACREWIERADEHGLVPDLAIVDYSLGDGTNGFDAIRMLRKRFGAGLPAIVVTGTLDGDVGKHAGQEKFEVMTKPVIGQALRSKIAQVLHRDASVPMRPSL